MAFPCTNTKPSQPLGNHWPAKIHSLCQKWPFLGPSFWAIGLHAGSRSQMLRFFCDDLGGTSRPWGRQQKESPKKYLAESRHATFTLNWKSSFFRRPIYLTRKCQKTRPPPPSLSIEARVFPRLFQRDSSHWNRCWKPEACTGFRIGQDKIYTICTHPVYDKNLGVHFSRTQYEACCSR